MSTPLVHYRMPLKQMKMLQDRSLSIPAFKTNENVQKERSFFDTCYISIEEDVMLLNRRSLLLAFNNSPEQTVT